jgi:hypothetical protein
LDAVALNYLKIQEIDPRFLKKLAHSLLAEKKLLSAKIVAIKVTKTIIS